MRLPYFFLISELNTCPILEGTYSRQDPEYWYVSDETDQTGWDTESNSTDSRISQANKKSTKYAENKSVSFNRSRRSDGRNERYERSKKHNDRDRRQELYDERREHSNRYKPHRCSSRLEYKGRKQTCTNSSSESEELTERKKTKSGISAKPSSRVREQLTYPHFLLGQVTGFIGQNLQFMQLSYDQFVAGKLTMIVNAEDVDKQIGRTELLQKIMLWKVRANVSWPQVRNTYAHILRLMENKEIDWFADWDRFEWHIYDKVALPAKTERFKKTGNTSPEYVYFCKAYQKATGCAKEAPHTGKVNGMFRQLQHICAECWMKKERM